MMQQNYVPPLPPRVGPSGGPKQLPPAPPPPPPPLPAADDEKYEYLTPDINEYEQTNGDGQYVVPIDTGQRQTDVNVQYPGSWFNNSAPVTAADDISLYSDVVGNIPRDASPSGTSTGSNSQISSHGRVPLGLDTVCIKDALRRLRPSLKNVVVSDTESASNLEPTADDNSDAAPTNINDLRKKFERITSSKDNRRQPPASSPKIWPSSPLPVATPSSESSRQNGASLMEQQAAGKMEEDLTKCDWYVGQSTQSQCEQWLNERQAEGAFFVRERTSSDEHNPYALCVFHDGVVFTIKIRRKFTNGLLAVGSEKPDEPEFETISDMVTYHRQNPIKLVGSGNKRSHSGLVYLESRDTRTIFNCVQEF